MTPSYCVVDQNQLRADALRERLEREPSLRLVLPDLGMFEMAKSSNRELTLTLSLEILSGHANRVYVSRALSECLHYELTRAVPVVGHVINSEATKFLRKLLASVASGHRTAEFDRVVADPEGHLSGLRRDYLDHDANRLRALELVEETKRGMPREFAERLRASQASVEEKIDFVYSKAPSLLVGVLEDNGFSRGRASRLVRQKSMLLRYFFVKLWTCLCWEEQGRIEGLGAAKLSNDLIDHEYVLAATFFDGLLSAESAVIDAYKAVTTLLARA